MTERSTADDLAEAATSLGDLAALVNNAGTPGEANAHVAHETPDDLWDETIRINLSSVHRLTSILVPLMAMSPAPNRSLVHLSSTAGHRVRRATAPTA